MAHLLQRLRKVFGESALDLLFGVRAVFFVGRKHVCPCCGWRLRTFAEWGLSLRTRHHGYCPFCNSKARHRRDWLFLQEHTDLLTSPGRVLHISPKRCMARRLSRIPALEYLVGDINEIPFLNTRLDMSQMPFADEVFDKAICIHVLEHIDSDIAAMAEMYRVLKSGAWALITFPMNLEARTYEDPQISDPAERAEVFGEADHVRHYGRDAIERIESVGFAVRFHSAFDLGDDVVNRYGLMRDEHVLICLKPDGQPASS